MGNMASKPWRWSKIGLRSGIAIAMLSCSFPYAHAGETVTYSYDDRGRLVRVQVAGGPNNGAQTTYQHDSADNRTAVAVTAGSGSGGEGPCTISVSSGSMLPPPYNDGPAYIGITRSGACASPTVVNYVTRDGTATAGGGYQPTSGTLTINSSSASVTVSAGPSAAAGSEFYVDFNVVSGSGSPTSFSASVAYESP